jgi:hypothetical protein
VGLAPTPACLLAPQLFTPHPMHTSRADRHHRSLTTYGSLDLVSVSLHLRPTLVALFACFLSPHPTTDSTLVALFACFLSPHPTTDSTLVALFACFLPPHPTTDSTSSHSSLAFCLLTAPPTHPPPTGLTPRICNELFQRIAENKDPNVKFRVECSYMEIYNERVRDLLAMSDKKVRFYFIYVFIYLFVCLFVCLFIRPCSICYYRAQQCMSAIHACAL